MIKERDGKYYVYNKAGSKALSEGYEDRAEALERLREIEYFKLNDAEFEDAEYKGKDVTLNAPFRTPDGPKKFAVYAKNSKGNVVIVRFGDPDMEIKRDDPESRKAYRARHRCESQTDKSSPAYWSCRMWSSENVSDILDASFRDSAFFDSETKTVYSARDGVQEYYGHEFGHNEADKVFRIIRRPEELAAIASMLEDLPVTNEHVDVGDKVPADKIIGKIKDTELLEDLEPISAATMALQNKVELTEAGSKLKDGGKKYFSLAYEAALRPYEGDEADLEQYNFIPHHLALVNSPRGGENLTFKDGKMKKAFFKDEDGKITLASIMQMAEELPAVMQEMDVEQLKRLKEEFDKAKGYLEAELKESSEEEQTDMEAEDMDKDMEGKDMEGEKEEMEDEKKKGFADAKQFADAVEKAAEKKANEKIAVVDKARSFLPEGYNFADSATSKIMADAVRTEYPDTKFADSELSTVFKMLKKSAKPDYSNFVDSKLDTAKIGEMEI